MDNLVLWIVGLSIVLIVFLVLLIKFIKENIFLKNKYSSIIDIDKAVAQRIKEKEEEELKIEFLKDDYSKKYEIFENLKEQVDLLQDNLDMCDVGLYEPIFNYDDSEEYKKALIFNRNQQKELVKDKVAVRCFMDWTVGGSRREGEKMVNRYIKLMLRAFNGECDSIICNVKWNNVKRMQERIVKAYNDLNKLGENVNIKIQPLYLDLKKEELWLTYEYEQKKYDEKEEQRAIREQMREEEKVIREAEKARIQREKDEKERERLEKIRKEAYEQGQLEKAQEYDILIAQKDEEIEKLKRTESNAQHTKRGVIYVISNIGSFGQNIYKIGMTRRDNPLERVDELGDASVPFKFDVHALIKSEDAPALENALHNKFKSQSVNRVNYRKEFFNVSLDEVAEAVKEFSGVEIQVTKLAEAREYRETLAIMEAENGNKEKTTKEDLAFPKSL